MRAEFQVLVLGYLKSNITKYLVTKRSDLGIWQFVSGGGEDDEIPNEAAKRELIEETSLNAEKFIRLDTTTSIPACIFKEHKDKSELYVVPEYAFAVELFDEKVQLSDEHTEYQFLTYDACRKILKYDSNRTALYELNERIIRGKL